MATAIALWFPEYMATGAQNATIRHVREVTGAKTLSYYMYLGQTIIVLDKKKEGALLFFIYNDLLARGERIAIYDARNRHPVTFRPGDMFTEAEYLSRYQLRYGSGATHPNTFRA